MSWRNRASSAKFGVKKGSSTVMSVAVQIKEPEADVRAAMRELGRQARAAARELANAPAEAEESARSMPRARLLRERAAEILAANAIDLAEARGEGPERGLDRPARSRSPSALRRSRAASRRSRPCPIRSGGCSRPSPVPTASIIERVATPLGVVGVIYESRPNVTADAGALCLKSGNAVVLRGGSDSFHSSAAIHACLVDGLKRGRPAGGRDRARALRLARGGRRDARAVSTARSTSSCRAGEKAWSIGFSARRGCRCSPISKASCMSMSTGRRISTRRSSSPSTPRCDAPASAARPRRCWCIAPPLPACSGP